jgi:chemotaxis protein CheX
VTIDVRGPADATTESEHSLIHPEDETSVMGIPSKDDLEGITSDVWQSFVSEGETTSFCDSIAPEPDDRVTGCVHISGAYTGSLTVRCSTPMARQIAGALFGLPEQEVTDAEVADAVGEIANIVGGNVKSTLPGPSALSLPAIAQGPHSWLAVPGVRLVLQIALEWRAEPFVVSLFQQRGE